MNSVSSPARLISEVPALLQKIMNPCGAFLSACSRKAFHGARDSERLRISSESRGGTRLS